ncbi:MAG: tRNA-dihydrouridine synthase [Thermoguttaceae bacterium]|nr:tRNA-dihydrouridine synthase [Thermoguttaceae bacterium]
MSEPLFPALKIGKLDIGIPLIQAPLSGYSDAPMRRLARKFGASFALCEVFLDQFVLNVSKRSKARFYLAVQELDRPAGAQLMGSSSEEFVPAALKLIDCGFELIDLNFACPVKKVLGRSRGGYLISEPRRAIEIARRVREAVPSDIPITAKLRKGYDDGEGSRENFFELLTGLLDVGVNGIAVHGRTVLQRYTGVADWNFLRDVKEFVAVKKGRTDFPVLGCGDLFSAETVVQRMRESGVDGVALARGIIGNPWLFTQTRAALEGRPIPPKPTLQEQKATIAEHYQTALDLYGENRTPTIMRKFGVAYSKLHPEPDKVRIEFVRCKTSKRWFEILDEFY